VPSTLFIEDIACVCNCAECMRFDVAWCKYGLWVSRLVRWSLIAERWYYYDTAAGGKEWWGMPEPVKYYLSAEQWDKVSTVHFDGFDSFNKPMCVCSLLIVADLLLQLHNHFDFGMVERIKMQFDEVNGSRTGMISADEFNLFLDSVLDSEVCVALYRASLVISA
jgi:hypothetical protein